MDRLERLVYLTEFQVAALIVEAALTAAALFAVARRLSRPTNTP